jgi:hypothetical protein
MAMSAPAPSSYSEMERALQVTRHENKQAREAFAKATSSIFAGIEGDMLFTGSAYEGLKVKSANEFHVLVAKKDWTRDVVQRKGFVVVQWRRASPRRLSRRRRGKC